MNELERRLTEGAREYPFPPTPALASAAARRLPPQRRTSPLVLALATVIVGLAATLAFSAGARGAVLDWLDAIPGIHIERTDELPKSRLLPYLEFGRPVSLATARRLAGFRVLLPDGAGELTQVRFDRDHGGTAVTLKFDRRLVLTEWQANVVLFKKLLRFHTTAERTKVGHDEAIWISGGDHAVFYFGLDPRERAQNPRLAGNVLVWQHGRVGYRLELAASKERAIELADSLR